MVLIGISPYLRSSSGYFHSYLPASDVYSPYLNMASIFFEVVGVNKSQSQFYRAAHIIMAADFFHVYCLSKCRSRIFNDLIIYVPTDNTYDSIRPSGGTELNIDLDTYFLPMFGARNAFVYFVYILLMQNVRRELKKSRGPRRLVKGMYLLTSPPAYLSFVGSIICLYLFLGPLLPASIVLSLHPISIWYQLYFESWWIPVITKVW